MFISINDTVINVMHIVSVNPEVQDHLYKRISYNEPDTEGVDTIYSIHINTVNFKHEQELGGYADYRNKYEYTFYMEDAEEFDRTYKNICDALGVVGDIKNVRHNNVQVGEYTY